MDYKLRSVPFRTRATPNITPFTYYDGATYLEILERLRKWLTDVLTPAFDDVVEIIDGMIQEALEGVERDLDEMRAEVQAALDSVAETDAELRAYVDDVLQQVINNSIELQDAVLAGIIRDDPESESRGAIRDVLADDLGRYSIDLYEGATDAIKLQAAIYAARDAGEDRVIVTPRAITIDQTIEWDVGYASLEFGNSPVRSTVTDGATFHVYNSRPNLTANVNKWLRGMELRGPGRLDNTSLAFDFDSLEGNVRGLNIENVEIRGFNTGLRFYNNAYLLTFTNVHVWSYDVGLIMPSGGANYGENIRFIASTFGSGRRAVSTGNSDGDLAFIGCSFDFMEELAVVNAGQVSFETCHIEMRGSDITTPILRTGAERAGILVHGGRFTIHSGRPQTDHLFSTSHADWGYGIRLSDVELFGITCLSRVLCGGSGHLYTNNVGTMSSNGSGASGDDVLTSSAMNRLRDPSFGSARSDYETVLDAYIDHAAATSRTESPDLAIQQIAPGRLRIVRKDTSGFATTVRILIPLTGDLSKEWGAGVTITEGDNDSSFTFVEGFCLSDSVDEIGRPIIRRSTARSVSTISLDGQSFPYRRNFGYTGWDRHERPWATHFMVVMNMRNLVRGSSVNFSEILITAR